MWVEQGGDFVMSFPGRRGAWPKCKVNYAPCPAPGIRAVLQLRSLVADH